MALRKLLYVYMALFFSHVIVIMPLFLTIIFIHAKTTWVIKNLEFH